MKLLILTLLFCSSTVLADGYHHHHGGNWVAPLIGGVAIGAIVTDIYRQPAPVYAPPPQYYPPNYGGAPYGYHYESLYDAYCGCYKTALIPN